VAVGGIGEEGAGGRDPGSPFLWGAAQGGGGVLTPRADTKF